MSLIENVIRPEIRAMQAYPVADASGLVKLDAMENPYRLPESIRAALGARLAEAPLNRYPIPSYAKLKEKLARQYGIPDGFGVMLGNGSDELISLLATACARDGARMLIAQPAFVMYVQSAALANMAVVNVDLNADFSLNTVAVLTGIAEHKPAITYFPYPNNPTANLYGEADMLSIIRACHPNGIVVVDEAYHPFARTSFMRHLPQHPNLVVMRTVSKLGLAGIRLGYMSAGAALLAEFEKVRPPYNINVLTEICAEFLLDHADVLESQAQAILDERERVARELARFDQIELFPSAANFLLIRLPGATAVAAQLLEHKILIKNVGKMHPLLHDCLRITIGTPTENQQFIDSLRIILTRSTT